MSNEESINYVQVVEGSQHFNRLDQIITFAGYIGKASPCTLELLIEHLNTSKKFGYDLIQEDKANDLKIAAYDRHLQTIEELEKENKDLKQKRNFPTRDFLNKHLGEIEHAFQIDLSDVKIFADNVWEQFQHSQKELHDTTLELRSLKNQWNKVVQQLEDAIKFQESEVYRPQSMQLKPEWDLAKKTRTLITKYILSLLKTEVKEGDK